MKLRVKNLSFRLSLVAAVCLAASLFPIFLYLCGINAEIACNRSERDGARMLNSLSALAHFSIASSDAKNDAKLKKSVSEILYLAPNLLASNGASKRNPRVEMLFSERSLKAFSANPDKGGYIVDMGAQIAALSGLYTDDLPYVHTLMDACSNILPQVYEGFIALNRLLKTSEKQQPSDLLSKYVSFNDDCKDLTAALRRVCALLPSEKSLALVGVLSKFGTESADFNATMSKVWQGKAVDYSAAAAQLSELELRARDLWSSAGSLLFDTINSRYREKRLRRNMVSVEFSGVCAAAAVLAWILSMPIIASARRSRRLAQAAVSANISELSEYGENSGSRISDFAEIDAGFTALAEKFSDALRLSEEMSATVSALNADAESIASEQRARLVAVSNGILRAEAKTELRDKSDATLAASASALRDKLNTLEQFARSQGKSVFDVSSEMSTSLENASEIMGRFAAIRSVVEKMGVIAETFTGVADQANILSLNLSIETAKAGIKGTGLGTLAEQIRVLSKRTVVSVIDIESVRDAVLEILSRSSTEAENFLQTLESHTKILSETEASLADLTSNLGAISASVNAVSVSLRERGAADVPLEEVRENLAKIENVLAKFADFAGDAQARIESAREKLSGYGA